MRTAIYTEMRTYTEPLLREITEIGRIIESAQTDPAAFSHLGKTVRESAALVHRAIVDGALTAALETCRGGKNSLTTRQSRRRRAS